MGKCKYCGYNSTSEHKFFVCENCGSTNEGKIKTIIAKDMKTMRKIMGEKFQ